MKNFISLLVAAMVTLFVVNAWAFQVPTPTGFVTDTTGKLTDSQRNSLNDRLDSYAKKTQNEIAIVLVSSLNGESVEDVAHQIFQSYKIGKAGLDNGVLILVAVNDRKMRLQTGKGVEGDITDIQANDILNSMKPSFKVGNFYAGLNTAVDGIQSKLDSRAGQKADPGKGQQFNQPVPQETNTVHSNSSCSVASDIGNFTGFGFGLVALFVGAIALVRRYIRKNEERKMRELEERIDRELALEKAQKEQEKFEKTFNNQVKHIEKALATIPPSKPSTTHAPKPIVFPTTVPRPTPRQFTDEAADRAKREAKARKEREEENRRRREREEEESRSSYSYSSSSDSSSSSSSSSSSFDWGSSSSDSGGFGGGGSGGGGSSSDF